MFEIPNKKKIKDGDISTHNIKLNQKCTVEEFVREVLKKHKYGWGCIGIASDSQKLLAKNFGEPRIVYKEGEIINGFFPSDISDQIVVKAKVRCANYLDNDYILTIKEE